jgi:hypothetical protein
VTSPTYIGCAELYGTMCAVCRSAEPQGEVRGVMESRLIMEIPNADCIDVHAVGVAAVVPKIAQNIVPTVVLKKMATKQFVHVAGKWCDNIWLCLKWCEKVRRM